MFDAVTIYVALGLLAGLIVFLLVFKKWDLPAYLQKQYKLNTRVKMLLFVLVFGIILAVCMTMLANVLRLSAAAAQLIEGLTIGFNCAVVVGLLRPEDGRGKGPNADTKTKAGAKQQYADNRGRRSKG